MASLRLIAPTASFGFDLLRKELAAHPSDNVLISPASVSLALGMTNNGARGKTAEGITTGLKLDYTKLSTNNDSYANLLSALRSEDLGVQLSIANAIWAKKGIAFLPEFLKTNEDYFKAALKSGNFDEATKDEINAWVCDSTEGKIPTILKEIPPEAIMYLLNVVHFKGDWTTEFDKRKTRLRQFAAPSGNKLHPTMFRNGDFRYTEDDDAQVVALPFGENKRVNLYVILPQEGKTVEQVLAGLDGAKLWDYKKGMSETELDLFLPKFEVEYDVSLAESLKSLGMELAFDKASADFGGMLPGAQVFINDVKHKTYAKVDEKGAEAAAATAVEIGLECCHWSTQFNVNRPFITVFADDQSGAVLFAGVVNDPKAPVESQSEASEETESDASPAAELGQFIPE